MPSRITPAFSPSPYDLEVARGNVSGVVAISKYGRNTDVDAAIEDVWSGASAIPQIIWLPPTQARTHEIKSTSATDDSASSGAKTIRVYGLTTWGTAESNEDISMDGTVGVNTANTYVIIHRLEVLTKDVTNVNVGTITATAATDATVTAQIEPGRGQTEMAILGISSTQNFYLTRYYCSLGVGTGVTQTLDVTLRVNPEPDTERLNYLVKHTLGLVEDGSSHDEHRFEPELKISGPAIIKVQAIASSTDNDVDAGFDGYLVTE